MKNLTIGADPEGFLYNPVSKSYVSSEGRIGGSKRAPLPIPMGAVLEDNVTAEFNTLPVEADQGESAFVDSIVTVREFLRDNIVPKGLELKFISTAKFSEDDLSTEQGRQSGCDPDYNIYTGEVNNYPPLDTTEERYCGGHIHIGHPHILRNPTYISNIVGCLDEILTSVLIYKEGRTSRINTYGAFGNFRPKPYGLEYRSPSNIWVDDDKLLRYVHRAVVKAMNLASVGRTSGRSLSYVRNCVLSNQLNKIPKYLTAWSRGQLEELEIL